MEPLDSFCLAMLVFLSLPLPLFAGTAIRVCPALKTPLVPWVWVHSVCNGFLGLLIVAAPFGALAALTLGCLIFLLCGTLMFRCVARSAVGEGAPATAPTMRNE